MSSLFPIAAIMQSQHITVSTVVYLTLSSRHVLHSFLQVGGCAASCPEVGEGRL